MNQKKRDGVSFVAQIPDAVVGRFIACSGTEAGMVGITNCPAILGMLSGIASQSALASAYQLRYILYYTQRFWKLSHILPKCVCFLA